MKRAERDKAIGCLVPFVALSGVLAVGLTIIETPLWSAAWLAYWGIGLGGWEFWAKLDRRSTMGFGDFDEGWGAALHVIVWPYALVVMGGEALVRSFLESVIPHDEEDDGPA